MPKNKKTAAKKKTASKKVAKKATKKKVGKAATVKKKAGKKKVGKKKTSQKKTGKKKAPLKKGDKVSWSSLNGPSKGKVKKKITRKTKIKSHKVNASPDAPQYLVESSKTGKEAAHSAKSLRKR